MALKTLLFTGSNYRTWGFMLGHMSALFLYNDERNHMLEFGRVDYWECQPFFYGDITIHIGKESDAQKAKLRNSSLNMKDFLIITHRDYRYIVQCLVLRSCNFGAIRPNKTDNFWFRDKKWERIWLAESSIT